MSAFQFFELCLGPSLWNLLPPKLEINSVSNNSNSTHYLQNLNSFCITNLRGQNIFSVLDSKSNPLNEFCWKQWVEFKFWRLVVFENNHGRAFEGLALCKLYWKKVQQNGRQLWRPRQKVRFMLWKFGLTSVQFTSLDCKQGFMSFLCKLFSIRGMQLQVQLYRNLPFSQLMYNYIQLLWHLIKFLQ